MLSIRQRWARVTLIYTYSQAYSRLVCAIFSINTRTAIAAARISTLHRPDFL
ncbi:hypothetical protein [Craterilacuibacter sinensis]|uniref:Uncharacterized protein n=1 Tax=Craterilacuibacter sinensis TaxID=2686017 RepID=A0A845BJN0_9NEIS|nr:hypothetical protein [Craterilacuibacter sinensis]MXR36389.1 hypothetical protein [Craterilacuibacter sinensis]